MGLLVPGFSFFGGLAYFSPDLRVNATPAAPPATAHPSIKESTKGAGAEGAGPPLWRWPKATSFMDGCVVAAGAADVAETKSGEK